MIILSLIFPIIGVFGRQKLQPTVTSKPAVEHQGSTSLIFYKNYLELPFNLLMANICMALWILGAIWAVLNMI